MPELEEIVGEHFAAIDAPREGSAFSLTVKMDDVRLQSLRVAQRLIITCGQWIIITAQGVYRTDQITWCWSVGHSPHAAGSRICGRRAGKCAASDNRKAAADMLAFKEGHFHQMV